MNTSTALVSITQLVHYPIKSCAGTKRETAFLDRYGIVGDRRFLLVAAATGRFLTQRDFPQMARLRPHLSPDGTLTVSTSDTSELVVSPAVAVPRVPREVTVWKYTGLADDTGDEAAAWFSDVLGVSCRLVQIPDVWGRPPGSSPEVRDGDRVSFADGYPLLLTNDASLTDLNRRLAANALVPMNRFRPNIVVSGASAWAEDGWRTLTHHPSGRVFRVAKPCARCAVITVDQKTGQPFGPEPLMTLAAFRRDSAGKVMFGLNLLHEGLSEPLVLRIGDELTVD